MPADSGAAGEESLSEQRGARFSNHTPLAQRRSAHDTERGSNPRARERKLAHSYASRICNGVGNCRRGRSLARFASAEKRRARIVEGRNGVERLSPREQSQCCHSGEPQGNRGDQQTMTANSGSRQNHPRQQAAFPMPASPRPRVRRVGRGIRSRSDRWRRGRANVAGLAKALDPRRIPAEPRSAQAARENKDLIGASIAKVNAGSRQVRPQAAVSKVTNHLAHEVLCALLADIC